MELTQTVQGTIHFSVMRQEYFV